MAAETKGEPAAERIRVFGEADVAAATEILKASQEAAQWTEWGFKELLAWRGVVALISEDKGKVIGFAVGRQMEEEAEILNLAVHLLKRREGEGGELLQAVMKEFRARQVSRVFLDVRESNDNAIAFYTKHGFLKTGRRANYYRDPKEAAIVMELKLAG